MGWDLTSRKIPPKFDQLSGADLTEGRSARRGQNEPPEASTDRISVLLCASETLQVMIWTSLQLLFTSQAKSTWCEKGNSGVFRKGGVGGERRLAASGNAGGLRARANAPRVPGRGGERSPAVLSGDWYTAGKLGGNARSRRGSGDNAGNTPLLGVRQTRGTSTTGWQMAVWEISEERNTFLVRSFSLPPLPCILPVPGEVFLLAWFKAVHPAWSWGQVLPPRLPAQGDPGSLPAFGCRPLLRHRLWAWGVLREIFRVGWHVNTVANHSCVSLQRPGMWNLCLKF